MVSLMTSDDEEKCTDIVNIVTQMYQNDKTQRWTHLGSGLYDIPVFIHKKLFRSKYTDISKIVKREYNLYKGLKKKILETELKLYQGLLSGRPSILSRSLSLIALVLSLVAVIFSLTSNNATESTVETMIVGLFPYIMTMLILLLVAGIIGLGQDRLSVREHHIRIIVLSYLLANSKKR